MCVFFLLQYFPAVITVQISQRTLITLMAIFWELVLKHQAKFIPEHHGLALSTHSQTNKQPSSQIALSFPSSPRCCQHRPTPDSSTGCRICPEGHVAPDKTSESQDANVEDGSGSA